MHRGCPLDTIEEGDEAHVSGSPLLISEIRSAVSEIVREENDRLLSEYSVLKPLMSIKDLARTLAVSVRTIETMLAAAEIPPALWISGQRRWHPDAIDAYLRKLEGRGRTRMR